jgi:hypothetical protein
MAVSSQEILMNKWILSALVFSITACAPVTAGQVLTGPDGKLTFTIDARNLSGEADYPRGRRLYYKVEIDNEQVIPFSPLGLILKDRNLYWDMKFVSKGEVRKIDKTYSLVQGKRRKQRDTCNEQVFTYANPQGMKLDIVARVYADGVAFRYRVPGRSSGKFTLASVYTGFRIPMEAKAWLLPYDEPTKWTPSYENYYTNGSKIGRPSPTSPGWCFPALFHIRGKYWVLLHEAGLDEGFCGMHLNNNCGAGVYRTTFPHPGEGEAEGRVLPSSALPWTMPWRVIIMSRTPAAIVESGMITNLNPPCAIGDTSWIKPGRVSWEWWKHQVRVRDYELNKTYIDFAADMGWEYCLIDANWNEMKGGDVRDLVKYAATKKVGIILWYNSGGPHNQVTEQPRGRLLDPRIRRDEFTRLNQWGVKAVKVDFFHTDKQFIMNQYLGILRDAAEHKLLVDFHGCTVTRGWSRTWPNLMTMEAVKGEECYGFDPAYPDKAPWYNVILAFTRNAVGAVDYTPVAFSDQKYPRKTSNAHELALAVVYQSGLLHFADEPKSYRSQPDYVRDFMGRVPAQFEDMKFLDGYPGQYVIIARRAKGEQWFVGGISGMKTEKEIELSLDFMGKGDYNLREINDGEKPRSFSTRTKRVRARDKYSVKMGPNGGFVLHIRPPVRIR